MVELKEVILFYTFLDATILNIARNKYTEVTENINLTFIFFILDQCRA